MSKEAMPWQEVAYVMEHMGGIRGVNGKLVCMNDLVVRSNTLYEYDPVNNSVSVIFHDSASEGSFGSTEIDCQTFLNGQEYEERIGPSEALRETVPKDYEPSDITLTMTQGFMDNLVHEPRIIAGFVIHDHIKVVHKDDDPIVVCNMYIEKELTNDSL